MSNIAIDGKIIPLDEDGFLTDPQDWNEEVARRIAQCDGIDEMNETHWKIVHVIRSHWEEKGMAPKVRDICQKSGVKLREIYQLFPLGPARGACRVAGLNKPEGCV